MDRHKLGEAGRDLILGVDKFNSTLTYVGIGFVKGSGSTQHRSYICVVVAPKSNKVRPSHASFY